jgi:hypothetical protein
VIGNQLCRRPSLQLDKTIRHRHQIFQPPLGGLGANGV